LYTDHYKEYSRGIDDFKSFLKLEPNDVDGTFNLGVAFYKNHDLDSAIVYFLKSIELDSTNGSAYNLLTSICFQKQDFSSAYKYAILAGQYGVKVDAAMMAVISGKVGK
jgi:tetratricopeptide (TPR) repeat protein